MIHNRLDSKIIVTKYLDHMLTTLKSPNKHKYLRRLGLRNPEQMTSTILNTHLLTIVSTLNLTKLLNTSQVASSNQHQTEESMSLNL